MSITKFRKSLSRFFKPLLILIVAVFFIGCFTIFGTNMVDRGDRGEEEQGAIAKVNGREIPGEGFNNAIGAWERQMETALDRTVTPSEVAGQKAQLLEQLIVREVLKQAAEKRGVRVSRGEVRDEINKMAEQQVDQERSQISARLGGKKKAGPKAVDRQLVELLRLKTGDSNMTIESHKSQIRDSMNPDDVRSSLMITKLGESIKRTVRMSEREMVDSYRMVQARHIVIDSRARSEVRAKKRADEVLVKLRSGSDFGTLAREVSDETYTKNNGGAWPYPLSPTQSYGVDPAITRSLFALKPGGFSDVIKTKNGFEIVKVDSEQLNLPKDFEAKKKQYKTQRLNEKQSKVVQDFYIKAMDSAKIEVIPADLQAYWLQGQARTKLMTEGAEGYKKAMTAAAKKFEKALLSNSNDAASVYSLASIYQGLGEDDKAIKALELALESASEASVEGPDLRVMLGDLYAAKGDNKRAAAQYEIAGEVGIADLGFLQQLVDKFNRVGKPDLAAKTQKFVTENSPPEMAPTQGGSPQPQ
ncbi:MAG: SurA N-terminal domain-containing protein [Armatimonadota bacterium]|nr:SurA N-terminal domain-containing protein [Armatimonadota bacterium]